MESGNLEWYYIPNGESDVKKAQGPFSERDLDVLWRTSTINSKTIVWKQGMMQWKQILDVQELKNKIADSASEMLMVNMIKQNPSLAYTEEFQSMIIQQNQKTAEVEQKQIKEQVLLTVEQMRQKNLQMAEQSKKISKEKEMKELQVEQVDDEQKQKELLKKLEKNKKKAKKQQEKRRKQWFQARINSYIYFKGLPEDITEEEINDFFTKAGVIRLDPESGQKKMKLYSDEHGRYKGDGTLSYAKEESIELAIQMLNEREIRPGFKVYIQQANFTQKGENYIPREKKNIDKVKFIKIKADQERMLSWNDDQKGEGLKIVILENVFSLEEAQKEQNFFSEIQEDIKIECDQKLGPIHRIKIYENNPRGIVEIKFKSDLSAEKCIQMMDGRFFGGRQIKCYYYDGVTKFANEKENKDEEDKRIDEFGKWLENQDNSSQMQTQDSS